MDIERIKRYNTYFIIRLKNRKTLFGRSIIITGLGPNYIPGY